MVRSPGGTKRNLSFGSHSSNTFVTRTNKISKIHHTENRNGLISWSYLPVPWPLLTLIESDDTWCIVCDMSHCVCRGRDWQPGPCPPAGTDTSLTSHTHGRAAKQSTEFHFRLFPSLPWTPSLQYRHRGRSCSLLGLVCGV